jgi:PadR family transcriptional regulator PadR
VATVRYIVGGMDINLTPAMVRVLQEFLKEPARRRFGMEIMRAAKVSSGSLYPALARLERAGWITGETEDIDPKKEGRPARRYYTMTADGVRSARLDLAALSDRTRPPVLPPNWVPGTEPRGI